MFLFRGGEIIQKLRLPNNIPVQETLRGPSVSLSSHSDNMYLLNEESCLFKINKNASFELLFNKEVSNGRRPIFTRQEYTVASQDGRQIPVHLFIPKDPKKMGILFVHGGPGERVDDLNDPLLLRLLKEGYEVIVPAYRGCAGYGEEHKNANRGEYGRADVWDLLSVGLDWKIKSDYKRPLACMGYSYGDYLTLIASSFPNIPWDCAITAWGVTRLEYLRFHLPKAYPAEKRSDAVRERNPLEQSKKISVPLLILHGEKDTTATNRDVISIKKQIQTHEGRCELYIYNDTHGLEKHRKEMYEQIFSFLRSFK